VIRIAIVTILMNVAVLQASGFDDMILWRYDLPGDTADAFGLEPARICRGGVGAFFLYCQPYSIGDLSWNTGVARYGTGRVGYFAGFLSYGYEKYYTRNVYSAGIALRIIDHLYASGEVGYNHERFLGERGFGESKLGLKASYNAGSLTAVLGSSDITLSSDYDPSGGPFMRPWVGLSYSIDDGIIITAGIKRTENSRTRWLFQQRMDISRAVDLHIGILNRPNVLYGGLDFSYRSVTLILTYYTVGGLSDTVMLGLAVGS
jgi:hypothetical protein